MLMTSLITPHFLSIDGKTAKNIRLEKLLKRARFHDEICFSILNNFDQYMI